MREPKLTIRAFLGIICLISWIVVWFMWVGYNTGRDFLLQAMLEGIRNSNNEPLQSWLGLVSTFHLIGGATVFFILLLVIIRLTFDKTPKEKEIEEAKKKIRQKYKLLRAEEQLKRLRRKYGK